MSLITPIATLSFPALFVARKVNQNDPNEQAKFSAALIFDEEAQGSEQYKALKEAALNAAIETFGPDAPAKIKAGQLKWPFLPGPKAQAPEGTTVIRARTTRQPGVVDGSLTPVTDPTRVYAGCKVRASLGVFAYNQPTNKGVSFGLNNIQFLADGERLDGRAAAKDEFDVDTDFAADMSAMDEAAEDGTTEAPAAVTGASLDDLL